MDQRSVKAVITDASEGLAPQRSIVCSQQKNFTCVISILTFFVRNQHNKSQKEKIAISIAGKFQFPSEYFNRQIGRRSPRVESWII